MTLAPGTVVAERYRVERPLGRGGMGEVVVAWDTRLDERVALKVMAATGGDADGLRARFKREAVLANRLGRVPGIVRARDWGELGDGVRVFLVLDLVPDAVTLDATGGALAARLARLERLAALLAQVHAQGVVHRDVKPQNVLVDGAGGLHLTDFGLGKDLRRDEAPGADEEAERGALTQTGAALGTPAYMPPEQFLDASRADARADVYALGVLLFLALTGRPPFGGGLHQIAAAQERVRRGQDPAPRPSALDPGVPAPLDDLAARATSVDPAGRPADAGEFAAALRAALAEVASSRTGVVEAPARDAPGASAGVADPDRPAGAPAPEDGAELTALSALATHAESGAPTGRVRARDGQAPGDPGVDATDRERAPATSAPTGPRRAGEPMAGGEPGAQGAPSAGGEPGAQGAPRLAGTAPAPGPRGPADASPGASAPPSDASTVPPRAPSRRGGARLLLGALALALGALAAGGVAVTGFSGGDLDADPPGRLGAQALPGPVAPAPDDPAPVEADPAAVAYAVAFDPPGPLLVPDLGPVRLEGHVVPALADGRVRIAGQGGDAPVGPDGRFALEGSPDPAGHVEVELLAAGHVVARARRPVVVDGEAPAIALERPLEGAETVLEALEVAGRVDDASLEAVEVHCGGRPAQVDLSRDEAGAAFSARVTLDRDGPETLVVVARDALGREARVVRVVARRTPAPGIVLAEPGISEHVGSVVRVRGRVTPPGLDDLVVRGPGGALARPDASGAFSFEVDARALAPADGPARLELVAFGRIGLRAVEARATRNVILDTIAPRLALTPVVETTEPAAPLTFTIEDASSLVTFKLSLEGPGAAQARLVPATKTPPPGPGPLVLHVAPGRVELGLELPEGAPVEVVVAAEDAVGNAAAPVRARFLHRSPYPAWFRALPAAARPPVPLPDGVEASEATGRYRNARDGSALVWIPAREGGFQREEAKASAGPALVYLVEGYFLGVTEVTVGQFRTFVAATGRTWRDPEAPDEHPVVVTRDDALAYCAWAGLRLPSEAEWEHAARGPTGAATWPWGEEAPDATRARLRLPGGEPPKGPGPVGALPAGASPYGPLDLGGNLREWCADWHRPYDPSRRVQPLVTDTWGASAYAVVRGGSWRTGPETARAGARDLANPSTGDVDVGFRVARSRRRGAKSTEDLRRALLPLDLFSGRHESVEEGTEAVHVRDPVPDPRGLPSFAGYVLDIEGVPILRESLEADLAEALAGRRHGETIRVRVRRDDEVRVLETRLLRR